MTRSCCQNPTHNKIVLDCSMHPFNFHSVKKSSDSLGILIILLLVEGLFLFACAPDSEKRFDLWRVTGGTKENTRYSTLHQIDTSNVAQLTVAWTYHSLDADTINHSQIQCNPIVVDGVLYATSPQLKLLAIDAATGKEKWVFDPQEKSIENASARFALNNNRGVTYWEEGNDKRILYTAGASCLPLAAFPNSP